MAASDSTPLPIRNQALRITFPLWLTTGLINTGAAGLDSEVSLDNGSFADCTNEATEIGSSGTYYLDLVQAEMDADVVAIQVKSSTTDAITYKLTIYPSSLGKMQVDVRSNAGTAITSASGIQEVKVASIAAGAINAAAIATDAIDADALKTDAITEIQNGLATASALATAKTVIDAIDAKTTNLPSDPADASVIAGRFDTLDTSVADLPTNAELATALGAADDAVLAQVALVKAQTDLIPADPAAVGDIPTAVQNADALLDRADAIETGVTPRGAMRANLAGMVGVATGGNTDTIALKNPAGTTTRATLTVDADGNRSASVLNV